LGDKPKSTIVPRIKKNILVIEDESITATSICESLNRSGYRTIAALNSRDALEIGQSEKIDLIISDIRLDSEDSITGIEAAQTICKFKGYIPILVMSGFSTKNIDVNVQGAVGFLTKPLDLDVLPRIVQLIFKEI